MEQFGILFMTTTHPYLFRTTQFATELEAVDSKLAQQLTPSVIETIIRLIPDSWLVSDSPFSESNSHRTAYIEYLLTRLEFRHGFLEEAIRAQSLAL